MPEIHIDDMQDGYIEWVQYVRKNGVPRRPRGLHTLNVRDLTVVLRNPERSLTQHIGRRSSTKLAALEALQLVGECSCPELMVKVAPNVAQFRNDQGRFDAAYGERVAGATELVVRKLREDRHTRQAVLTIFNTATDLRRPSRDVACTVALFFEIADEELHCKAVMRSNDVTWGVAYDVFQFTTLQRTMAGFLGVGVGEYRHSAYSSHLYMRDLEALDAMHPPTQPADVAPSLWSIHQRKWQDVAKTARQLIDRGSSGYGQFPWWTKVAGTWQ